MNMRKSHGHEIFEVVDEMPEAFWPLVQRALPSAERAEVEKQARTGKAVALWIDNQPAGYSYVRWVRKSYSDEYIATVNGLYLEPQYRGGRVGLRLIEETEKLARSGAGTKTVEWRCGARIGQVLERRFGYEIEYIVYRKTQESADV